MIPFNKPYIGEKELEKVNECLTKDKVDLSGDGRYTKFCEALMEKNYSFNKVMLTSSCSSALEMCALMLKNKVKDKVKEPEIIIPSFTFVTSANGFAKFGFKIRFVDIDPKTMNISLDMVQKAVNPNVVAVMAVNYGGISCDLEKLKKICDQNKIYLFEDAAQSIEAKYKDKYLGSYGDLATFSFHETKNITSGEGGCLVINNDDFLEHANFIREKGTNRKNFIMGLVDKYSWVEIGGHYLMSEMNAALLFAQLENSQKIKEKRIKVWQKYNNGLLELESKGFIEIQKIPEESDFNAHMFWIKLENKKKRDELLAYLKENDIIATFHYIALHSSVAGKKYGEFCGEDIYTTKESERLIRLPMFYDISDLEINKVINKINEFFND